MSTEISYAKKQNITAEKLQKYLPKGSGHQVTENVLEIIQNMENDTGLRQEELEEKIMSHMGVFKDMKVDYVVRALGSNETSNTNQNTPLDLMGGLLAKKFNAKYVTNILTKERTQQLKFAGNQHNRKQILDHKYNCNLGVFNKNATYLIIDDVSTTGTTFHEISRAIREASRNHANINTFALVQTLWNRDYTSDKQSFNQKFYQQLTA